MARHTSFRFCLDLSVEQERVLRGYVGAARFAYNQTLRLHENAKALARRVQGPGRRHGLVSDDSPHGGVDDGIQVPWTRFDLINAFNAWKRSEAAGRRFVVGTDGTVQVEVIGLAWRHLVPSIVLEEAAADVGRALTAWNDSRAGTRKGPRVGFPRFKKKSTTSGSFRVRNQTKRSKRKQNGADQSSRNWSSIRVGDGVPRSVSLPRIGTLRVREDTRQLRRMIAKGRSRILSVTVTRGANRWWISIAVEAADLHPAARHSAPTADQPARADTHTEAGRGQNQHSNAPDGKKGWTGVDRGLHALAVAGLSDGTEVLRADAPRAFRRGLGRLRRLSRAASRKKKGSKNRTKALVRLSRQHARIRNRRRHVLHQVSNQLVKNHALLVLEDLNITGMKANRKLSRAISDAAWGELARQVTYKQAWRGGQVMVADRWFPSSKNCSTCGTLRKDLTLKDRVFECRECGHVMDRDLNAAVNLAAWAENHNPTITDGAGRGAARAGDRQAAGPVNNAHRQNTPTHPGSRGRGGKGLDDVGTNPQTAPTA